MIITAKELRKKFKEQWPDMDQVWLRNKEYSIPDIEYVKIVLDKCKIDLPVIHGFNECENFALFLHAAVKKYCVENLDITRNWAFGDFICDKDTALFGEVVHSACLCLCADGFYIVEPMENNLIVKANGDYKPFFINLM